MNTAEQPITDVGVVTPTDPKVAALLAAAKAVCDSASDSAGGLLLVPPHRVRALRVAVEAVEAKDEPKVERGWTVSDDRPSELLCWTRMHNDHRYSLRVVRFGDCRADLYRDGFLRQTGIAGPEAASWVDALRAEWALAWANAKIGAVLSALRKESP